MIIVVWCFEAPGEASEGDEKLVKQLVEHLQVSREARAREIIEIKQANQRKMDVAAQEKKAAETDFARRIESLEKELNQERLEKSMVEDTISLLRLENDCLKTLLDDAEAEVARGRERLLQSQDVLGIPSTDLQITEKKLGSGSYGGTCVCRRRI